MEFRSFRTPQRDINITGYFLLPQKLCLLLNKVGVDKCKVVFNNYSEGFPQLSQVLSASMQLHFDMSPWHGKIKMWPTCIADVIQRWCAS